MHAGPKGPLGPLGPLRRSLRSEIHARNPQKWSATPFASCPEPPKMGGEAAHFGLSGHEIKGVADHLGGFRAGIPERSDFLRGPKAPRAPWARSEATFLRGPKAPRAPWARSEAIVLFFSTFCETAPPVCEQGRSHLKMVFFSQGSCLGSLPSCSQYTMVHQKSRFALGPRGPWGLWAP